MNNQKLLEYINYFREKAEQGKLVIFVGAGVSCNVAGMPDWSSLIQDMADAIGYTKCTSCRHKCENCESTCLLKYDYSADEFLKIPQYVFNMDQARYKEVLTKSISNNITADAPLSSAIFDINPAHIITTNYDQLLETSENIFCEQYQVIIFDKDLLNADKGKYIIKMHGDLNFLDSIVLKEQDYLDYSQNHVLMELFIKSLLTDHIVLFLGYSLNDYNIKLILSWLNFMRSQNDVFDNNRRVGFIVLDQEKIDDTQLSYFIGNNIGVINIHSMPLISKIPDQLSHERGKRLYSFLRVIANPDLEKNMFSIESAVEYMSHHTFLSCEQVMKLLYVRNYLIKNWNLQVFSEDDYIKLTTFIEKTDRKVVTLRKILLNAGVVYIRYLDSDITKTFTVGDLSECALFQDVLYDLYFRNKYDEIKTILDNDSENITPVEKYFYRSIISGYDEIIGAYDKVDISEFHTGQKVAYLHNSEVVHYFTTFRFNSSKIEQFIQNIPLERDREMFSEYINLYKGNTEKLLEMQENLDKLKRDVKDRNTFHIGGMTSDKIYEIKRLVIPHYFFYFYNHILFQGFSDLYTFIRPYIEAIICANSDAAEISTNWMGMEFINKKYPIDCMDLDILTKYISTKDLYSFVEAYHIRKLNVETNEINFLTECFQNLCSSLVATKVYGFRQSSLKTFSNLILLLNFVDLDENNKKILETTLVNHLSDKNMVSLLFSTDWPDFRLTLQVLSKLIKLLSLSHTYEAVYNIIKSNNFINYAVNVDFGCLRQLIVALLPVNDGNISLKLQTFIDSAENFHEKIIFLRLFYQNIEDESIQKSYRDFLSLNFMQLSTYDIYDFISSGWFTFTCETAKEFLTGILEICRDQSPGVYTFPNPLEIKLECAYLLYINDIISDISVLKDLTEGRPHLQFLLNPEEFDYTQVDFSNYMWVNFARKAKYMKYFIAHKDTIISSVKERIEKGDASDSEKKILYGFLLDKDEIWKI